MTKTVVGSLALALLYPAVLLAQPLDKSVHWGIIASVTPHWAAASAVGTHLEADEYDISGAEFSVGFVRGRNLSDEWGVSFVMKSIAEGSTTRFNTTNVCYQQDCVEFSTTVVAKNVSMLGVEAHKFFNFATIRRRVQIGANLAGGVTFVRGRSEKIERSGKFVTDPTTGITRLTQITEVSDVEGGWIFSGGTNVEHVLSAKAEIGVGFILTRSLKVRVSGGVNFPGYHIASVKVIYFLGRRTSIFG